MVDIVGTESILKVENLYKNYGSFTALKDVNLDFKSNVITGLLGPNGAGKTTLVKSILRLVNFQKGRITINGKDSLDPLSRSDLAYFPEKFFFFPFYKVEDYIKMMANFYGVNKENLKEGLEIVLEKFRLTEIRDKKLSKISKGQMQRAGLASIYISDKSLLIFDEPFSGLDPLGIRELKDLIKELKSAGKTIIICSHILAEVEKICDHIVIIDRAEIKFQGALSEIGSDLEQFFLNNTTGGNG